MRILDVVQGSEEWKAIRANYLTASEASAMMGFSKYMTRSELLRQKATGHIPDVDPAKQSLFDRGHAAEAAARPLVEAHIGDELYPTTGSLVVDSLPLLASFDGLSMTGEIAWESKLWNADLAAAIECNRTWSIEELDVLRAAARIVDRSDVA